MQGDILFPLNTLKETAPKIYSEHVKKYIGREKIMKDRLPIINCLWNDVLHLSAIHPSQIKQALKEAGLTDPFDVEYFEVDPSLLNTANTIVYLYKNDTYEDKFREDNYISYDLDSIDEYSKLPQQTTDYYKEMIAQGKKPLLYHKVPHILFKGTLDISELKRIKP